jgi:hypothetical protein
LNHHPGASRHPSWPGGAIRRTIQLWVIERGYDRAYKEKAVEEPRDPMDIGEAGLAILDGTKNNTTDAKYSVKTKNPGESKRPLNDGRCQIGISGLDDILGGGIEPGCFYLIQGDPGSGKTTLALQFLLEGLRRHESVFYVTLSETKKELEIVAKSHGWSLHDVALLELSDIEALIRPEAHTTIFHPSEMDLETHHRITARGKFRRCVLRGWCSIRSRNFVCSRKLHYVIAVSFCG